MTIDLPALWTLSRRPEALVLCLSPLNAAQESADWREVL